MAARRGCDDEAPGTPVPMPDVVAAAFHRLLGTGRAVGAAALADDLGAATEAVEETLAAAERASRVRRFPDGSVHGAAGLSVVPTRHLLLVAGRGPRYTWCAYDALGILAALQATGRAVSTSPWSGKGIDLAFAAGDLEDAGAVVLFLAERADGVPAHEWCPYVNVFASEEEVPPWVEEFGIAGRVMSLEEACRRGVEQWGPIVQA